MYFKRSTSFIVLQQLASEVQNRKVQKYLLMFINNQGKLVTEMRVSMLVLTNYVQNHYNLFSIVFVTCQFNTTILPLPYTLFVNTSRLSTKYNAYQGRFTIFSSKAIILQVDFTVWIFTMTISHIDWDYQTLLIQSSC